MSQERTEILVRAVGRRKEAVAQVKIVKGTGKFLINNKLASDYLHNNSNAILSIQAPFDIFEKVDKLVLSFAERRSEEAPQSENQNSTNSQNNSETGLPSNLDALVKVEGGGLMGQTEAIKLAISRAVCQMDSNFFGMDNSTEIRKNLKDKGYLTQDSRIKERRKYGLRKARKAPQYNKR